jgi:hypothetical protein
MTSGGRELLKWIAVLLMTGDHVIKVFDLGYVPGVSELGRAAFPLFGLVMAFNLAQPECDVAKSVRRLSIWGLLAQPGHALAFGYWLPVNVLFSFAVSASVIWAVRARQWALVALLAGVLPAFVDYNWLGMFFVVGAWLAFHLRQPLMFVPGFIALCIFNLNGWALLEIPIWALGVAKIDVPRTGRSFYVYYVGHLLALGVIAYMH